jgi:hypothetical protein
LPERKSGWSPVPVPIVATIAAEFAATGSESTRMFQGLSGGNIAQPARRGRWAAPPSRSKATAIAVAFMGCQR